MERLTEYTGEGQAIARVEVYDAYDDVICELENIIADKPHLDFYRCFLSQEEAEAALKELERGKGE